MTQSRPGKLRLPVHLHPRENDRLRELAAIRRRSPEEQAAELVVGGLANWQAGRPYEATDQERHDLYAPDPETIVAA